MHGITFPNDKKKRHDAEALNNGMKYLELTL